MKLSVFQALDSLSQGLNGDAGADSLQRSVSMGKGCIAQQAWLTRSLNRQESSTSSLTGQWSQTETFEGIIIYLEQVV